MMTKTKTITTTTTTTTTNNNNNNQVFRSRFLLGKLIVPQQVKNFPRTLWKLKVHYRVHNSLPLVFMSQIKQIDTLLFYLFKIHFNIIHLRLGFASGHHQYRTCAMNCVNIYVHSL
jgi:hypothetical protein